ncbi:hypothetical protein N9L68_08210 [bacterium]|nr:hypothetical protein [bacterium]
MLMSEDFLRTYKLACSFFLRTSQLACSFLRIPFECRSSRVHLLRPPACRRTGVPTHRRNGVPACQCTGALAHQRGGVAANQRTGGRDSPSNVCARVLIYEHVLRTS